MSRPLLAQGPRHFSTPLIAAFGGNRNAPAPRPLEQAVGSRKVPACERESGKSIERVEPLDRKEAETKLEVLRWVDSGVELCRLEKPATPPQHLVSYIALVDGDYLLLVDHINAGLWLPSGGHVEPEEHPQDTVRRELREELGLPAKFLYDGPLFLTVTDTVGRTRGHTDVSLWYVVVGNRSERIDFDDAEFHGVNWFHRAEVPYGRSDPEMSRFVRKLYGA